MHSQNQKNRMSANIPFEIQSEIIRRVLPVKSLLRFRSVSKQWKSLINSSEFIMDHSVNQAHRHHLLVRYGMARYEVDSYFDFEYKYEVCPEYKYVSIVDDDDSFPQHKFSPVVSPMLNLVPYAHLLDSSHGLVCLYGYEADHKIMAVIWNPSIRKSVGVRRELSGRSANLGFGVCPKTNDPKIVMITRAHKIEPVTWKAEVFTLSSRAWRSISMNLHFSRTTRFNNYNSSVVVDGVIYWGTYDASRVSRNRIISFDLISEEFGEVDLSDSLARGSLCISKLNKSLIVLHFDDNDDYNAFEMDCDVWMMMRKNGFEKLFTVVVPLVETFDHCRLYGVVGFRKNGQPIREHPCGDYGSLGTSLEAYDPSTNHICDLGIQVDSDSGPFKITSYTESLLLLNNNSDYIIQG